MSENPPELETVTGAYCALADLRKGDIRLPSYMGNGTSYIKEAADEIDAALGQLYVTPIIIATGPQYRPSILFLKKINWLIASGRLLLDMAAASEDKNQHSYGKAMLDEGLAMLAALVNEQVVLFGADLLDKTEGGTKPSNPIVRAAVFNEDPESLVEQFYKQRNPYVGSDSFPIARPYGLPQVN